jgi:hypothetical protein
MAGEDVSDWNKWSVYVLKELERLNSELKERESALLKAIKDGDSDIRSDLGLQISGLTEQVKAIRIDVTTLNTTLTNSRIDINTLQVRYALIGATSGGGTAFLLLLLEWIIKTFLLHI